MRERERREENEERRGWKKGNIHECWRNKIWENIIWCGKMFLQLQLENLKLLLYIVGKTVFYVYDLFVR